MSLNLKFDQLPEPKKTLVLFAICVLIWILCFLGLFLHGMVRDVIDIFNIIVLITLLRSRILYLKKGK